MSKGFVQDIIRQTIMGKLTTDRFAHKIALFAASGFGSGLSPISPGTCGSISACLIRVLLARAEYISSFTPQLILCIATATLGFWATNFIFRSAPDHSSKFDPQFIVIDEWLGMFITLLALPTVSWSNILICFALFRFFDISKIWPIGSCEKLPGAWGVLMDDMAAGLLAALVACLIFCN